jgi:transcription elongation factor SPT6
LVLHGVTTKNIFVNVAGFLRIRQDDLDADLGRDAENSEDPDVLDDTRIHPEDYDVARKMAADAMDYDEEDLEGAAPSKAVTDLLADDTAKLNDLALDEFAAELTKVLNAPKRFVLYKIREELQRPFGEKRVAWFAPNAEERFTMWTGETRKTLDVGLIIPVRVLRVSQDESVLVRLDCGIDGIVGQEYRTEGAVLTRLTPGQTLQAMVMKVDYDALRVELTTRESLLEAGDTGRRQVPTDAWFDTAAAQADSQIAVKSQQKNAGGRAKRVIKHPNFQDISAGKAEEFLAGMQRGDCVIRPSSREDHLAVTWKVDEGLYQHLGESRLIRSLRDGPLTDSPRSRSAVHELNKPDEYSLGTQLRISDKHRYSDLDELIDAHIKQMARKVTELTMNDRFKGSQDSLDKFLTTWTNANPGRSIYAFGWNSDRRKAGQVVLGFRTNDKVPIAHWVCWPLPQI